MSLSAKVVGEKSLSLAESIRAITMQVKDITAASACDVDDPYSGSVAC